MGGRLTESENSTQMQRTVGISVELARRTKGTDMSPGIEDRVTSDPLQMGGTMTAVKPVGRGASAIKYDVLTAVGAYALARDKHDQRLILRFMTLIVARYNWARDHLSVGQDEIARLWSVDPRTVKRDMARLRAMGWLVLKQQGARGRVARYGLDLDAIRRATCADWGRVGPDFDARMSGGDAPANVVPLRPADAAPPSVDGTAWSVVRATLHQEDPAVSAAWFQGLTQDSLTDGRLTLRAPSRFHAGYVATHFTPRLLRACQDIAPEIDEIRVIT